jgi:hypothetical protein
MQESMLFHTSPAPNHSICIAQVVLALEKPIPLRRALQAASNQRVASAPRFAILGESGMS